MYFKEKYILVIRDLGGRLLKVERATSKKNGTLTAFNLNKQLDLFEEQFYCLEETQSLEKTIKGKIEQSMLLFDTFIKQGQINDSFKSFVLKTRALTYWKYPHTIILKPCENEER